MISAGLTQERTDVRKGYGELRVLAIGIADGIPLTVIYTDRSEYEGEITRRIISARVSNQRERKAYIDALS